MRARRILALVAMASLVPTLSFAVDSATPPTPAGLFTPAAVASPNAQERRSDALPAAPGKRVFLDAQTFDGGAQVGTTAAGASKLTFMKRIKCTVDPPSLTVPGMIANVSCAATGAAAGDFAACSLPLASSSGVVIKSVAAATDVVSISLVGISDAAFPDVGSVDIQCLVVR